MLPRLKTPRKVRAKRAAKIQGAYLKYAGRTFFNTRQHVATSEMRLMIETLREWRRVITVSISFPKTARLKMWRCVRYDLPR